MRLRWSTWMDWSRKSMKEYEEEDFLSLAGIQHFVFCRRQWALIYIEQQWAENLRTIEGHIMHEAAHDDEFTQKRGDIIVTRGMPVFSRELGVNGVCDVVEFHKGGAGVPIIGWDGMYLPIPIEYKKGAPKEHQADELQLCCQAMCLEAMLACEIPKGYLYYGETKHRQEVPFTGEMRGCVRAAMEEMHDYYSRRYTPKVTISKRCKACSLSEICIPKLCKNESAKDYINARIGEVL